MSVQERVSRLRHGAWRGRAGGDTGTGNTPGPATGAWPVTVFR